MTNPLTKSDWSMLLRVLEHGEVLHPWDAERLAAKIRAAQAGHPEPIAATDAWEKNDSECPAGLHDRAAPVGLMRRFAV